MRKAKCEMQEVNAEGGRRKAGSKCEMQEVNAEGERRNEEL